MEAYCVKCKQKRNMDPVERVILKNGRPAARGVCPVCSTRMMKFLKADDQAAKPPRS